MSELTERLEALADALVEADEKLLRRLTLRRDELGLSVSVVAERMGVAVTSVRRFEAYDANPRLSEIRRYALAIGVQVTHEVWTVKQ